MTRSAFIAMALLAMLIAAPAVNAHERYFTEDDQYLLILGEQNEPVYTYDWTNLDLFVRDNATGNGIEGIEETVNATLIAPNGEELSLAIEPQHGSTGEYAFVEDYFLTLPGQYKVRLEGTVNGTDVTGEYLLPGPRGEMAPQAFPQPVEHDLRALAQENQELRDQVENLEERIAQMDQRLVALEEAEPNSPGTEAEANAPGFSALAALVAVGAVLFLRRRD